MLKLQVHEKEIENLTPEEEFVRGTVGAKCQINFDEFWQSYNKYIVFKRVGYEPINFMVDTLENEIEIPYTILAESGEFKIGVFGITETETLPTLYSKDIKILYGTDTHGTTPPTYIPSEIDQLRLSKQDKLVSGENIKTVNGESVLGSGNIKIQVEVDQIYDPNSTNAQSGTAVDEALSGYVMAEVGKGLSSNDFTNEDKEKLYSALQNENIDKTYNPTSENAQSGKAVAQAVSTIFKQSKAQYGDELISADGWTLDGWTGDFASGFVHTVGKTGILTFSLGNTGTNIYCLEFDVTSPTAAGSPNASTAFTVTIGNSPRFITYDGGGSKHYCFGIKSVENGDLKFIPTDTSDPNTDGSTFDGTISNISLKQIISYNEPSTFLKDIDSNVNILEEKRFLYDSIYVGKNSGQLAIQGSQLNFAFGNDALRNNTTGYWNTAIGSTALRDNTLGSRNVAIGKMALEQNVTGDRNIGIGSFTLCRNINGRNNIGIGADSLWNNISGNGNIGIGLAALGENKTGSFNVCIGYSAMPKSTGGEQNIAIGYAAMNDATTGKGNIGIGYWALRKNQANYNIAIGSASLRSNTTGSVNLAIGQSALELNVTGTSNLAIGHNAGKKTTGSNSTFIGNACGENVTGQKNTLIGYAAAKNLGGGSLNVIIGYNADASAGLQNSIAIGYNATVTKSNAVVIGNDNISETLLKGNLIVRGTDGTKRKILFNTDGSITWSEVSA